MVMVMIMIDQVTLILGKYTVPVLWDKKTSRIVNNESALIVRMLNSEFNQWATGPYKDIDLYPPHLQASIDSVNDWVYMIDSICCRIQHQYWSPYIIYKWGDVVVPNIQYNWWHWWCFCISYSSSVQLMTLMVFLHIILIFCRCMPTSTMGFINADSLRLRPHMMKRLVLCTPI